MGDLGLIGKRRNKSMYEELTREIRDELRGIRKAKGLSQSDVACEMQTQQSLINRLESDKHLPTLKTLCMYAAALGCNIKMFIYPVKK